MSYCTFYNLTYAGKPIDEKLIVDALAEINPTYFSNDFDDLYSLTFDKFDWETDDEDMIELSKRFPYHHFTLTGYGEDREDIWRNEYWDGHMKTSRGYIVFEEEDI